MSFTKTTVLLGIILSSVFAGGCSFAAADGPVTRSEKGTDLNVADSEIESAMRFIEKAPTAAAGYTQLAVIYIRRGRQTGDFAFNAKAETAVARALEIDPADLTARKLQASLHLTYHRFAEALEAGKQLTKDSPDDWFVYGVLTDANTELGNYKDAVASAQKMVDLRPGSASYARVGHVRWLHGDHSGAVEMLSRAAQISDPLDKEGRSWYLVRLGEEFWRTGKFDAAEKAFDDALASYPNYHLALAAKGKVLASKGDLDGAEKYLNDAQDRVPNPETVILLGDVYTLKGETEKAESQYQLVEVVEQKLGLKGDQKRLALFWADHDKNLDAALEIATTEYASRKDIFTADTLAWCLFKKGRADEAKKIITEAMSLKTGDARMLYHAGMIDRDLGNKNSARALLKHAIEINPAFDLLQAQIARKILKEYS